MGVGRAVGCGVLVLAAGAATFVGTLTACAVSHARGGTPFAFSRLAKLVVHYFLTWPPWAGWRRRR